MDYSYNNQNKNQDISIIKDVHLNVEVELGRTNKKISEILNLSEGSLIELDNEKDSDLGIYINGKLVAKGEVVILDEQFGIRVTEIIK